MLTAAESEFSGELPSAANLSRGLRAWQAERRTVAAEAQTAATLAEAAWRASAPERKRAGTNSRTAKRRAAELKRFPAWADREAIRRVYAQAREMSQRTGTPYHVDHDFPLQGRLVSGLHVHNNLRILPGAENSSKGNRFEVEP